MKKSALFIVCFYIAHAICDETTNAFSLETQNAQKNSVTFIETQNTLEDPANGLAELHNPLENFTPVFTETQNEDSAEVLVEMHNVLEDLTNGLAETDNPLENFTPVFAETQNEDSAEVFIEMQNTLEGPTNGLAETDNPLENFTPVFAETQNQDSADVLVEIQNTLERPSSQINHTKDKTRGLDIEVKGGYFFFSDHTMRQVYNQGGEDVQFCFTYPVWKIWNVYGSIEYLWRHGRSLNDHQRTRIEELPLTLGIKPIFSIFSAMDYYFTIGPRYTFVWVKNDSSYVDKRMHKSGFGGFVGTGFVFYFAKHWILDVFGEYAYTMLHFHSSKHNAIGETRQVGGFTFGLGLGYQL